MGSVWLASIGDLDLDQRAGVRMDGRTGVQGGDGLLLLLFYMRTLDSVYCQMRCVIYFFSQWDCASPDAESPLCGPTSMV
jgi:hypothetical protein